MTPLTRVAIAFSWQMMVVVLRSKGLTPALMTMAGGGGQGGRWVRREGRSRGGSGLGSGAAEGARPEASNGAHACAAAGPSPGAAPKRSNSDYISTPEV
jgi:hypothetical protein